MNGDIFDSKGFHVGVVIGPAIFDLKGKKLYDLKGTNIYGKPPRRDALRRGGLMVENCTYGQSYDQCVEST